MELQKISTPNTTYTTDSQEMANEMASYHQNIQNADLNPQGFIRNDTINEVLNNLPQLNDEDHLSLDEKLTYTEIELALKHSPNDKAPSLNGIPTEIYKTLHKCHMRNQKNNKPTFDIIALLRVAYNDIEDHGIHDKRILEAWLCPIYKKKDQLEIDQ